MCLELASCPVAHLVSHPPNRTQTPSQRFPTERHAKMNFHNGFRSFVARGLGSTRRRRSSHLSNSSPRVLEVLEQRLVLSAVSISGNQIAFLAGNGEVNNVTVSEASGIITIRDTSSVITAGAGVTVVNANEVTVPAAGMFQINITTLDLDDTLDASGLTIASGLGRTVIQGGSGNDTLIGSGLDDFFIEETGNDFIDGLTSIRADQWAVRRDADMTLTDATLTIGSEVDSYLNIEAVGLNGGVGDNIIDASAATPASGITGITFNGDAGNDTLIGGTTRDSFQDRLGFNTFVGGGGTQDSIFHFQDSDMSATDTTVTVGSSVSSYSGVESLNLWGGAGDNVIDISAVTAASGFTFLQIQGFEGNDTLTGSALDDRIRDSGGANILDGGGGRDELFIDGDHNQVVTNSTVTIGSDISTHTNFEEVRLTGGNGDNTLDTSALTAASGITVAFLSGRGGSDTMLGGELVEIIDDGEGNNTVDGGGGNDRWTVRHDGNITGADGIVIAGPWTNTFANIEDLRFTGGANDNIFDIAQLTAASGVDFALLSAFGGDDTFIPSSDALLRQSLNGGIGNDELDFSHFAIDPNVVIGGPGGFDGQLGTFAFGANVSNSFNNIDVITPAPVYDFTAATYSSAEGNATNTTLVVEVTRSVNTTSVTSVDVTLTDGSATSGDDFIAGPITVNFLPGEVTKSVPIELLGEDIVELNETISLSFANAIAGTVNPTAELTITNDDAATVSIGDVSQFEMDSGQTAFEFDITLSAPVDAAVSLQTDTADDLATVSDGDYGAVSGNTVSFAASTVSGPHSETVTVLVNGDTNSEIDESFFVNLTALLADGRDVTFDNVQAVGTILNDDVSNLPPVVLAVETDATFATKAEPGDTVSLIATFTDPNVNDSHTATIAWGDGTTSIGTVNQSTGEVTADHSYSTGGLFDVVITIDDGTASDTAVATAVVSGMRLTDDGTLQIIGTDNNDSIHAKRRHGNIRVRAKAGHGPQQTQSFAVNDVALLVIHTCDGRDHIHIHHNVDLPTIIDSGADRDYVIGGSGDDLIRGGSGNDFIWGGSGNDILLGGTGHDWLLGNSGRDVLIGGTGNDVAFGGSGQDILIGGSTIHDNDDLALSAIRDEWSSNKSLAVRRQNLLDGTGDNAGLNGTAFLDSSSLIDDNEFDWLVGGWGTDWFPNY